MWKNDLDGVQNLDKSYFRHLLKYIQVLGNAAINSVVEMFGFQAIA